MKPNESYTLVGNEEQLQTLLCELSLYDMAAVDTEADSMHHYHTRLCLIQITLGESNWLLDPLLPLDLSPIFETRAMQTILVHGSDYDLRLLKSRYDYSPKMVFDTMIAAKLLGKQKLGLSNLVEEYFGIVLKKDNQKADWTIRPLPQDMTDYAIHDTIYLHELAAKLGEELLLCGRFFWFVETCLQLIDHAKEQHIAKEEPWRISGSKHLAPRCLNLLKFIWEWREREAKNLDRPPYKVLHSDLMLSIVRSVSASFPELDWTILPRLPRNFVGERLESFQNMLLEALASPVENWPKPSPKTPPPEHAPNADLLAALKFYRDEKAKELSIDPAMIANRNQLIVLSLAYLPTWEARYQKAKLMQWQQTLWNEILRDHLTTNEENVSP